MIDTKTLTPEKRQSLWRKVKQKDPVLAKMLQQLRPMNPTIRIRVKP